MNPSGVNTTKNSSPSATELRNLRKQLVIKMNLQAGSLCRAHKKKRKALKRLIDTITSQMLALSAFVSRFQTWDYPHMHFKSVT
jgi:hypothetical protein